MGRSQFKLNHAGMAQLLKSGEISADMMRRAESAASAARGFAPVESGAYQGSIHAESATTDRAVGRVVADVDYALVVEAKTRTLGRSVDAAGG
jgi:hypothetical protein